MAREIAAVERMDEASTVAKIDDCSGWASDRYRSRTTSAMATRLPELILASYSCARRDHMVRLTRALPLSVPSAFLTILSSDSLRMPTVSSLPVGTLSVILSFSKLITNSSRVAPAISCSSMLTMRPTPWAGYTIYSLVRKPCLCCGFFFSGITLVSLLLINGTARRPIDHASTPKLRWRSSQPLGRTPIRHVVAASANRNIDQELQIA